MQRRKVNPAAFFVLAAVIPAIALCGCSLLRTVPSPEEIIKTPFGTESIKIGMTKKQVESLWDKPDEIKKVENRKKWKGHREMWVYRANYTGIPIDAGYLSKTKKLYFDGDNLTEISE